MKLYAFLILALVAQSYASWSNEDRSQEEKFIHEKIFSHPDAPLTSSNAPQFQSSASRLPQSQTFKNKISQRLAGSETFSANPQYTQKLIEVAEEKLEKCKTPSGQELDSHCVGRAIGQVMQMIATVENVNRQRVSGDQRQNF